MDVIALHAAGFQNAVATLGTAITPEQARIMRKYTERVVISYDSDEAGQRAADKALRLLSEAGIDARVLHLPGAKDPDEYIKAYGSQSFQKVLSGSRSPFDYKIDKVLQQHDITVPEEKAKAARALCEELAALHSKVEQDIYAKKVADALEIALKSVQLDTANILKRRAAKKKKDQLGELIRRTAGTADRVDRDRARAPRSAALERTVLGMMLAFPEHAALISQESLLTPEDFFSDLNRRLFCEILSCREAGGFDFAMLSQSFTPDEVSKAAEYAASRRKLRDNSAAVFRQAALKLREEAVRIRAQTEKSEDLNDLIGRRRKEME